jgi:hypothetical protein
MSFTEKVQTFQWINKTLLWNTTDMYVQGVMDVCDSREHLHIKNTGKDSLWLQKYVGHIWLVVVQIKLTVSLLIVVTKDSKF